MEVSNCQDIRIEIEESDAGQQLSLEACSHVETCAPCRAFRDERAALRSLMGSLPAVSAPSDFDWKLRARLTRSVGAQRRWWHGSLAPGAPAIAIAASFALLVSIAVIFKWKSAENVPMGRQPEVATVAPQSESKQAAKASYNPTPAPSGVKGGSDSSAAYQTPEVASKLQERRRLGAQASGRNNSSGADSSYRRNTRAGLSRDMAARAADLITRDGLLNPSASQKPVIALPELSSNFAEPDGGVSLKRSPLEVVTFGAQERAGAKDKMTMVKTGVRGSW
jgi:hypothetical protein